MEKSKIVKVVTSCGYTSSELDLLFLHIGKSNLADFNSSIAALLLHYFSCADEISGAELTGLYNLYAFHAALTKIAVKE